jgi:hypothetical protein
MIVNNALLININLVIHPMCVIEENAIIDFILVWFIPIMAPNIALIIGTSIMNFIGENKVKVMIDSGASFCHVERIMHDSHDIDVITDGNHM